MPKLTLQLDTLRVESFPTAAAITSRGTVRGHDGYPIDSCTRSNAPYACPLTLCCTNEPVC